MAQGGDTMLKDRLLEQLKVIELERGAIRKVVPY